MTPEDYIRLAMKEAERAVSDGERPFGVVVVDEKDEIVYKGHGKANQLNDPTAHGEVIAIRELCKKFGTKKLEGYSFYINAEPCPICFGSMVRAHVAGIYFGARTEEDASMAIPVEVMMKYLQKERKPKVIGDILAKETLDHRENLLKQEKASV
jgi:tRNA(adenine34) deaminase